MERRRGGALVRMVAGSVVGLATLAGCSPLPGRTLDPVYLKLGSQPPEAPVPTAAPAGQRSAPEGWKTTGAGVWVGRYRDSRGEGEVMLSLVRDESTVTGIWKFRTGGGGPVRGTVEANGRRFRVRMENTAPECPGTFEGWAEFGEATLVGAYHGKDCEGPVSDGWLQLRLK